MPKDVTMNSNHVESGLTPVDAYASSVGNCGGINACRAYFHLNNGLTASDVANARLSFGEDSEAQGIESLTPAPSPKGEGSIYTLDGVKLDKMPTRKGVYIMNGRKVVVK